jgi:SsrA-binding protein
MPVLAVNKKARFDYQILETFEAGIVLFGHEVKSIKTGHISLKGSFVTLKQDKGNKLPELYLINTHIPLYKHAGSMPSHDPYRSRKLLLHKNEIKKLIGKKKEQGLTLVPLKVYTKRSLIKLEFGLAKGKKKYDKREDVKKRELDRSMSRVLKRR